jgi:hypothetical protein
MKPIATGNLAEMVRILDDEAKSTSHAYVIQLLSFGRYENLNDTESINDLGKPS